METTYSVNNGEIKITTTLNIYDITDEFKKYGIENVEDEIIHDVLGDYCAEHRHEGMINNDLTVSLGQEIRAHAKYMKKFGR